MKVPVSFRIIVHDPLFGVSMTVQKGKDELLVPKCANNTLLYEIELLVDLTNGRPNFLGPYAQGPKNARFIYLNSGTYASQNNSCWSRRAKLSLMSISKEDVEEVLRTPLSRLQADIIGTGGDGGPVCASIKGLVWKVVR